MAVITILGHRHVRNEDIAKQPRDFFPGDFSPSYLQYYRLLRLADEPGAPTVEPETEPETQPAQPVPEQPEEAPGVIPGTNPERRGEPVPDQCPLRRS